MLVSRRCDELWFLIMEQQKRDLFKVKEEVSNSFAVHLNMFSRIFFKSDNMMNASLSILLIFFAYSIVLIEVTDQLDWP